MLDEVHAIPMTSTPIAVVLLFNHVDEDEYEKIRHVDPATLSFEPEYDIHVATIMEEYRAVARALRRAGYRVRLVNIRDDVTVLERLLRARGRPDVVFNLVEHYKDDPEHEAHIAGVLTSTGYPTRAHPRSCCPSCDARGSRSICSWPMEYRRPGSAFCMNRGSRVATASTTR